MGKSSVDEIRKVLLGGKYTDKQFFLISILFLFFKNREKWAHEK